MNYAAILFSLLLPVSGETLHYAISWPSGLSLGEATLNTSHRHDEIDFWESSLEIDASVPGFAIRDHYHSKASGQDVCASVLDKTVSRGARKSQETVSFDQDQHRVTRETRGENGRSSFSVPACARDALSFLQFVRNELAGGRLAPQQPVVLGGAYNVRLETSGTETVKSLEKAVQADRIQVTIKGAVSSYTVQILFARDPARTPVLIRIPLPLGTFTAELTR